MKNCLLTPVFLIILFSCQEKRILNNTKVIDLTKIFDKKNKVNLSEVASSINYLPLQTDLSNLISKIDKPNKDIKFYKNNILVNDASGEIFLFNKNGKYLNKIGGVGKGPHEYIDADAFTVIERNGSSVVAVYSAAMQKVKFYSLNGNYINYLDVNFWPNYLTTINNDLVFINLFGRRKPSNYCSFSLINENGKLHKQLFYKEEEKIIEENGGDFKLMSMDNNYKLNNTLHYWESNYDTIWKITDDYLTIPKYVIDIGDNKMPLAKLAKKFDFEEFVKYDRIELLQETNRYLFFNTLYKGRLQKIYYDKVTEQSSCVEFKRSFGKGKHFSFYNDIDGGLPFWPTGKASDSKVFMLVYGYEIKEYIEKKGGKLDSSINLESYEKLLEIVKNSKMTDNPMLMVVTLKN